MRKCARVPVGLWDTYVVLIFRSNQLIHINIALYLMLSERNLEQFVVLDELIVRSRSPIDAAHGYGSGKQEVGNLTSNGSRCGFFDFAQIQVKEVVEEIQ